jgi:two-component system LytT family response regulator
MLPTKAPVRALIVDDEEPGRINVRCLLAAHDGWEVAGECASAAEARTVLAAGHIDVIFLDIQMPRESGLSLARSLCAEPEPPLVIFVTAFDAHAVDAFELHALDYLLKPFNAARLARAVERATEMLALRQRGPYGQAVRGFLAHRDQPGYLQRVTVRSVGKLEVVHLDEVRWISAASNYVQLHLAGRTVLHRLPLAKMEESLDPQAFLRVHRSVIVRASQLRALDVVGDGSYSLHLHCGASVPVSERHVRQVRALLDNEGE